LTSFDARPELKRLYATLLKAQFPKFLVKKDFDCILLENNVDEIWEGIEDQVRRESKISVLIPGYTGYAEKALLRFMVLLDVKDKKLLAQVLYQAFSQHSEADFNKHRAEIRERLHEAGYPLGTFDKIPKRQTTIVATNTTTNERSYNLSNLHPSIKKVSENLYLDGYFPHSILEAYKAINNLVKKKSGRQDLDGQELMSTVFSYKNPIIKLNEFQSQSDIDEQMGFMFLYMGAMTGIRNPKAHDTVEQKDPIRTMEYLALASLLARRLEEGTLRPGN
jgi:uncharacterized protein (TIGR02391 family)